jgi:hypothetical protein
LFSGTNVPLEPVLKPFFLPVMDALIDQILSILFKSNYTIVLQNLTIYDTTYTLSKIRHLQLMSSFFILLPHKQKKEGPMHLLDS